MGKIIEFDWMYKDEVYAHVTIDTTSGLVTCEELQSDVCEMFLGKRPKEIKYVLQALEARCVDRNRPDISDFLKYYGIKEYNPYELCLRTHGVSKADYHWVRWHGESLKWDDVRVRE